MIDDVNYQNNPLHGLNLKTMLTEIVDHYGFEIIHAYLWINTFKINPSIDSSVKFLKKTTWAREKVEGFYLYKFKNLPKVASDQFELPPRDRIIPEGQVPGEPCELTLEDAERMQEQRAKLAQDYDRKSGRSQSSRSDDKPWQKAGGRSESKSPWTPQPKARAEAPVKDESGNFDPWANSRNKLK